MPKENKGLTLQEAYKALLEGKKIKRKSWWSKNSFWVLDPSKNNRLVIRTFDGKKDISYGDLTIMLDNCLANDWEIIEE